MRQRVWIAIVLLGSSAGAAGAQEPMAPAGGDRVIRAVRVDAPLVIDGRLDEAIYEHVSPEDDFVQYEPAFRGTPSERTDVWVAYDDDNVYVAARLWESRPERMIVNEMRRDSTHILNNELFAFALDTFFDRRNAVVFAINPLAGRADGQVVNEETYNADWNPVWQVVAGRFDGGWTVEAALPFQSLRYRPGEEQVWGFQARRSIRWRNELLYLTSPPMGHGLRGIYRASVYARLEGLRAPPPSRNLDVKPFAIGNLTTDLAAPPVRNDPGGDVGLDVKYGITPNLTADVTLNTDFAQVEADEQQVNLTRYSLFFPEKREFFLENAGLFVFGNATGSGDESPVLFYSRRIGLDGGQEVPIIGGGRVTGRVGAYGIGALHIQTGAVAERGIEATNFTVLRLRRDVLRRSTLGAMYTRRSVSTVGTSDNQAYGVDGRLSFFDNLTVNTYWARSDTPGLGRDNRSHRMHFVYDADRYAVVLHHLMVGEDFMPEAGFLFRNGMTRNFARARFSPRPTSIAGVRQFRWEASVLHLENRGGRLETRNQRFEFATSFENSDELSATYLDSHEFIDAPFEISDGVVLPRGGYDFGNMSVRYAFGSHRPVSGTVSVEHGSFWSGEKTTLALTSGRMSLAPQLAIEPSVSYNRVTLPAAAFTTAVLASRVTYTVTPLMFVSSLLQYASTGETLSANVRFRWEYRPGSELFVVYNETRDARRAGYPDLQNRAVIVKVNRLFRF